MFLILKALCSPTHSFTLHIFDSPSTSSHLLFFLYQLYSFLHVFLCTWRTKHPTKHKASSCLQHLLQSEAYGNFFFSLIIAIVYSVMLLLPRPISWTEKRRKNFSMLQSIILMTFLPRWRERQREREGEFSVFLLPALSTLGSTIQSKLNKVIRSVWGCFPRAEPFRIFCSFSNAEMLSSIAWFLQTMLCNVHLICIYNTALQEVTIIQTKPDNISMLISLCHFPFSSFSGPKELIFLENNLFLYCYEQLMEFFLTPRRLCLSSVKCFVTF